jgi:beta-lactamase class A
MNDAPPQRVAHCHIDAQGHVITEDAADEMFYAASTLKLGLAIAVLREIERGAFALDTMIPSRHRFTSAVPEAGEFDFVDDVDEIDDEFPEHGTMMSIADCLSRTIEYSSNEGSNMLTELVGYGAVNAALHDSGATTSYVQRLVGDLAAREAGLTLAVSARDLARLMQSTLAGTILNQTHTELLLGTLRAQKFPLIVEEQSPVSDWGSKSGWVTGIRHDVAWFVRPGEREAEILAVCTEGFTHDDAVQRIREVSDEAFRPRGAEARVNTREETPK